MLMVGQRLRELREAKNLSQGDIEKESGLLRCYLSRCENGHTVPSVDTLQKWARALNVPLYQIFYDGDHAESPTLPKKPRNTSAKAARESTEIARLFSQIKGERNRELAAMFIRKLARKAA